MFAQSTGRILAHHFVIAIYQLSDASVRDRAARLSGNRDIQLEYTVNSNISSDGLNAVEAGSVIAEKAKQILEREAAGNRLEQLLKQA